MISFKVGIWEVEKGYSYQILRAMEYVSLPRVYPNYLYATPRNKDSSKDKILKLFDKTLAKLGYKLKIHV